MSKLRRALPIAIVALLVFAAPGFAGVVRHVVPSGATGNTDFSPTTACITQTCSLDHALTSSADDDIISLAPGAYSFTSELELNHARQTITTSSGRASLTSNAATAFHIGSTYPGVHVSNIDFVLSSSSYGIKVEGSAAVLDHISERYTGSTAGFLGATDTSLGDSLIVATSSPTATAAVYLGGTIRNSTIVAQSGTGSATAIGRGCSFVAPGTTANLAISNTILKTSGTGTHYSVSVSGGGCTLSTQLDYSEYEAGTIPASVPPVTVGFNNITDPPQLDSAYQELPGSPSVNKGTSTGITAGETDLFGDPRVFGSAPDIGADEYYVAPPVSGAGVGGDKTPPTLASLKAVKKKGKLKTFDFSSSEAGTATFKFEKPYKKKHKTKYKSAGSQTKVVKAGKNSIKPKKLKRGKYRLTLTVKDAAGNISVAKTLTFSTK